MKEPLDKRVTEFIKERRKQLIADKSIKDKNHLRSYINEIVIPYATIYLVLQDAMLYLNDLDDTGEYDARNNNKIQNSLKILKGFYEFDSFEITKEYSLFRSFMFPQNHFIKQIPENKCLEHFKNERDWDKELQICCDKMDDCELVFNTKPRTGGVLIP